MGTHILALIEISSKYIKAMERHGAMFIQQEVVEASQILLVNMDAILLDYYLVYMH